MNKYQQTNRHIRLALCLGVWAPLTALAAGPGTPGAGTLLQQVQPAQQSPAGAESPNLNIRQDNAAPLTSGESFLINDIRIQGNSLIETEVLRGLVHSAIGRHANLADLNELAGQITQHYRSLGFALARAIVPAQTIENGAVTLQVIEPRLNRLSLDNRSDIPNDLINATLASLEQGQFIAQGPLDRSLLLLSDIPGVTIDATLKPGDKPATSDLDVQVLPAQALSAQASIDGYGSRYTGRVRLGGALSLANPLRRGDLLSIHVLSSASGIAYGRLAFDLPVSGQGTHLAVALSELRYQLGDVLAPLSSHGSAKVASLWMRHPFWRSTKGNLHGQLQLDALNLRDHTDSSGLRLDRHVESMTASLHGDVYDMVSSASVDSWNVSVSSGRARFDDSAAASADAATARTSGHWSRWNVTLSHQQAVSRNASLHVAIAFQGAGTNLDPSQKMTAGGPTSVRAYDVGALSGDAGALLSAEWRQNLGAWGNGQLQLIGFVDATHLRINQSPWTPGVNDARLSGAGLGLNWSGPQHWMVSAFIANRIGPVPPQVGGDTVARLWISGSKSF
jgi:hemolysin activation/secretion protein